MRKFMANISRRSPWYLQALTILLEVISMTCIGMYLIWLFLLACLFTYPMMLLALFTPKAIAELILKLHGDIYKLITIK